MSLNDGDDNTTNYSHGDKIKIDYESIESGHVDLTEDEELNDFTFAYKQQPVFGETYEP